MNINKKVIKEAARMKKKFPEVSHKKSLEMAKEFIKKNSPSGNLESPD